MDWLLWFIMLMPKRICTTFYWLFIYRSVTKTIQTKCLIELNYLTIEINTKQHNIN